MIVDVDRAAMVVTKRAETAGEATRLGREAAVLDTARHPGVTELLAADAGSGAGGAPATIRLRAVPGEPLTDLGDLADREVAGLGVALATTLADLHDLGVVHGAVSADHVLVDPAGQPVLCSFGRGATAADDDRPDPAADVAGLAAVLESALLPPGRARDGRERAALRRTLARAGHPDARRRPGARRLAAVLIERVPGAALPVPAATAPAAGPPQPQSQSQSQSQLAPAQAAAGRWNSRTAAGALAAAGVVLLALSLVPRPRSRAGRPGPAGTSPLRCPPADAGCLTVPRPAGMLSTAAGSRYQIGQPTDRVVVGRWRCQGPLAALLRPATGEVWVFEAWATPEHPVPARLVARVAGAVSLAVDAAAAGHGPGCDRLLVDRQDRAPLPLDP